MTEKYKMRWQRLLKKKRNDKIIESRLKTQHLLRNFTTNRKSQTASSNKQKNTKSTHSNNQDIVKIANRIKRKYSAKYAIHIKRSTIGKQENHAQQQSKNANRQAFL